MDCVRRQQHVTGVVQRLQGSAVTPPAPASATLTATSRNCVVRAGEGDLRIVVTSPVRKIFADHLAAAMNSTFHRRANQPQRLGDLRIEYSSKLRSTIASRYLSRSDWIAATRSMRSPGVA
jgi:hypothetical protein